MAVSWIARLARSARAPVFALAGHRGKERIHELRLSDRITLAATPRHASVLLVAGSLPRPLWPAARLVHDQVPSPRGVLVWGGGETPFPDPVVVAEEDDPVPAMVAMHRALLEGERPSTRTLLPERNPVHWRGVGPHGQGGEGMMGGKPYGRSMAMTGADLRDGLELDRWSVTVGPFLPWLPPGLELELELQGDVVQELTVRAAAFARSDVPDIFARAERERVSVRELELSRARHHVQATADLLLLHGLDALAERALRLVPGEASQVRGFERTLVRTGALGLATRGVGVLPKNELSGTGPLARAAGIEEDARTDDPAYRGLGFEPLVQSRGDAEARFRQRLEEAAQALELAARAGERVRDPDTTLEGVRGPVSGVEKVRWTKILSEVAAGQAWDDLATTLVSMDLDAAQLAPSRDFGKRHVARGEA